MTDVNAARQPSLASSAAVAADKASEASGANGTNPPGPAAAMGRTATGPGAAKRWPLSRIVGVAVLALLLFSLAAIVAGGLALLSLHDNRQRVTDTLDPAALEVKQLNIALLDQETGVRGYALSGQQAFLAPYTSGVTEERNAIKALQAVFKQLPGSATADLQSVITQAHYWRTRYAEPTINEVSRTGKPVFSPTILTGKADFDALRAKVGVLQADVSAARAHAVAALNDSATVLDVVFIAVAVGLAAIVVLLALGLRATAIRPLHRLAAEARRVADGDFGHEVSLTGPREVTSLAADVNRMRERILQELSATKNANTILQAHTEELERSNTELEQFAYIASHDLQEPLRKVASFTQLLQRRYAGQLDARADQYIEFAVDGAKRMQALINDLLSYSRVGRSTREPALVSSDAALSQARNNLAAADGGDRRHRGDRAPAAGAGRADAAHRGVPEPAQQRAEVQRRQAAAHRDHHQPRRALLAVLLHRQRDRDRAGVRRADLRDLPAPARAERLPGDRHRPGHDQEDHRVFWRADMA